MTTPVFVYRIVEDGESFCVQADTMQAALVVAEQRFVDDNDEAWNEAEGVRPYYHRAVLQSCELLGELVNPVAQ